MPLRSPLPGNPTFLRDLGPLARGSGGRVALRNGLSSWHLKGSTMLPGFPFLLALAAFEPPPVQLVQSVPSETRLAHPELPHTREVWPEMIRGASRSLDLAQFYVHQQPGGSLEPVLREMERAGARGVRIRLLLAPNLLQEDRATLARLQAIPNLELRIFDLGEQAPGILHAKVIVVDGREAFVGSQNFDSRALDHIHELGARIRDRALLDPLMEIFETDWAFAKDGKRPAFPAPRPRTGIPGRELLASPPFLTPPSVRPSLEALLDLLGSARRRLRIQLLNYSPLDRKRQHWPPIDNALRAAAARGVQVQLLVSEWNSSRPRIDHLKSLALVPGIEVRMATIPEASSGYIPFARTIHSKYLVVDDDVLWLGTSNWSQDYFLASRNVELIFREPALAAQGSQVFERLWTSPYAEKVDPCRTYLMRKHD